MTIRKLFEAKLLNKPIAEQEVFEPLSECRSDHKFAEVRREVELTRYDLQPIRINDISIKVE